MENFYFDFLTKPFFTSEYIDDFLKVNKQDGRFFKSEYIGWFGRFFESEINRRRFEKLYQ